MLIPLFTLINFLSRHGGAVISTCNLLTVRKARGAEGLPLWCLHVLSPCLCGISPGAPPFSTNMHIGVQADWVVQVIHVPRLLPKVSRAPAPPRGPKRDLTIENGWGAICNFTWLLVFSVVVGLQGVPCIFPKSAGMGSITPQNPAWNKAVENGWE